MICHGLSQYEGKSVEERVLKFYRKRACELKFKFIATVTQEADTYDHVGNGESLTFF